MRNLKYLKYFLTYFKGSFRNYRFISTGESQFKEFLENFKE